MTAAALRRFGSLSRRGKDEADVERKVIGSQCRTAVVICHGEAVAEEAVVERQAHGPTPCWPAVRPPGVLAVQSAEAGIGGEVSERA